MKRVIAISLAALIASSASSQTIVAGGIGNGVTFANPTGTVGSTSVNGSAATAMRSDAAPALAAGAAAANLGFTPPSISGTPTTGDCVEWASATQIADVGVACGSGGTGSPGGSPGQIQFNNAGAFGGLAVTGSGSVVLANSPTLVAPALGTPSALVLTNATGLPNAAVLGLGTFATQNYATPPAIGGTTPAAGSFSSLTDTGITGSTQCLQVNASGVLSGTGSTCGSGGSMVYPGAGIPNSTGSAWGTSYGVSGSGSVALTTSPVFTTPTLGAATATTINGNTITTGSSTLTGSAGKTLSFSNSIALGGTDGTAFTFPATSGALVTLNSGGAFTGYVQFNNSIGFGNTRGMYGNTSNNAYLLGAWTPSCSATGGSPTCTMTAQNGSAAQEMTLGSAGSATSITITPGFTAHTGFVCDAFDATTTTERLKQTATTTTTATLTFYNDAGVATSPGASDVIWSKCLGL